MADRSGEATASPLVALFDSGTMSGRDDADLVDRYLRASGTEADGAFAALVARHGPLVLGVARRVLRDEHAAHDASQATFLVLARRAGSIRRPEALASWLFGVSTRVARRTRLDRDRRAARERRAAVPDRAESPPAPSFSRDDCRALIEEVDRLPPRYRAPVVLCDLEGMTYEAAARHLRCPLGTLSIRLKRARERLRSRLARRGVAPIPTLPLALAGSVRVGPVVAPQVAALAAGIITIMRIHSLALGLLGLALATGTVGLSLVALAGPQDPTPAPPAAVAPRRASQPPARAWTRTIPNGPTVELLGYTPAGYDSKSWRDPEGRPLAAPYSQQMFEPYPHFRENRRQWEVAIRVVGGGRDDIRYHLEETAEKDGGYNCDAFRANDATGRSLDDAQTLAFRFILRRPQGKMTLQLLVVHRPWITWRTSKPSGGTALSDVIFGASHEVDGRTVMITSHNDPLQNHDVRFVAVDHQGTEHPAQRAQELTGQGMTQMELE